MSGAVTFDGAPVPNDMIVFTPDSANGNSGPQGKAVIRDGRFDTSAEGGMGVIGGPSLIEVKGAAGDKPICEHKTTSDLPKSDSIKDIDVPKSAKVKPGPVSPPA